MDVGGIETLALDGGAARGEMVAVVPADAMDRLAEAEDALRAIAAGEVDAFVLADDAGQPRVFSLETADRPYRVFVENMRDGAATVSSAGVILFANRRLAELLLCARDTIVGSPLSRFLASATPMGLDDFSGSDGTGVTVELDLLDADGGTVPVLVGSSPLAVGDQQLTCLTFVDVRHQKAAEFERRDLVDRLYQSQRLEGLGRLAGGVAHDFNNLLATILNYAGLILGHAATTETVRDDVEQIQAAAKRAVAVARQLLTFARLEAPQTELVDVNVSVNQVAQMLDRSLGAGVEVVVHTNGAAPIHADSGRIDQVLVNLLLNARDAMPDGGTLTIETRCPVFDADVRRDRSAQPARYVELSVGDTGTGMSAHTISHAFEPFYTTKPHGQGTGLGLASVYGIVAEAGGTITITSEADVGTTFTVLLPMAASIAPTPPAEVGPSHTGDGQRILVVDDELALLEATVRMLSRNGYRVMKSESGSEALIVAAQNDFDLVLTDLVMPNMSGYVLAAELRALHPRLTVLFMSGYSRDVLDEWGLAEDENMLIEKPFTAQKLLAKINTLLMTRT